MIFNAGWIGSRIFALIAKQAFQGSMSIMIRIGNEDFLSSGSHTGDGLDTVWSEGTLGVVMAYYAVGRNTDGDFYLT